MLNIQKEYLEYLEKIKKELNEVGISTESIETLNDALLNTELLAPVVGAFSAGKSALINSFLGNQYLSVGITPETALATELRYSNKKFIEAVKADNSIVEYAISEMNEIKNIAEKIEEQLDERFDISKKIISIDNDGGNSLEKVIKEIAPEELFKKLFITD